MTLMVMNMVIKHLLLLLLYYMPIQMNNAAVFTDLVVMNLS